MKRIRQVVPILFASFALGSIVVLYMRPEWVLTALPELNALLTELDPVVFLLGSIAILAVTAIALVLRAKLFSTTRTVETTSQRTESAQSLFVGAGATGGQLGASFDSSFEIATDYAATDRSQREVARAQTVDELRSLAVETYRQAANCDIETARSVVATGEWTADQRAAGLLADDSSSSIPLRLWLWDLLLGRDPYTNSVDHTLTALESILEVGLTGEKR